VFIFGIAVVSNTHNNRCIRDDNLEPSDLLVQP